MKKRQPRTFLDYAVARGGIRKGTRVGLFMAQWVIAQQGLGLDEPTVDEVADWWKENRATWFRRQAEFRQLFPDQENACAIARHLIEERERHGRQASKAEVGAVLGLLGSIEHGITV